MDALEASGLSSPGPEPEENGNEKDGYELPVHLKKLDELMNSVDDYRRLMDQAVEAVFEARFAELLPQNAGMHLHLSYMLHFKQKCSTARNQNLEPEIGSQRNSLNSECLQYHFYSVAFSRDINLSNFLKSSCKDRTNGESRESPRELYEREFIR